MTQEKIKKGLNAVDAVRKSSLRLSEMLDSLEVLIKSTKEIVGELDAVALRDKSNADRMTKFASEMETFRNLPNTLAAVIDSSVNAQMDEVVNKVTERLERHHKDEIARLQTKIMEEMPRTILGRRGRK